MMDNIKFDEKGLIPAIVQDHISGKVLMLAYMNEEALNKTISTARTWFFSRSRQSLWMKGEESGNVQEVKEIRYDCDEDTLLILVEQTGVACHTGHYSCFYRNIDNEVVETQDYDLTNLYSAKAGPAILLELADLIKDRKKQMPEDSYTTYLFTKGLDKILKKVGEENAEVIIAAKNRSKEEVVYEVSDLIYHLLVLLAEQEVELTDIFTELRSRR